MLLWFRNDLRVHDNPALLYFMQQYSCQHQVKNALFFISKSQWQQHHVSDIKIDLILRHVTLLKQKLLVFGITLNVVECEDFHAQVTYLRNYCLMHDIDKIVVNSEVEINERERDEELVAHGVELITFESDVIVPKGKILNGSGEMFKVFTPFKKSWLKHVRTFGFDYISKNALTSFENENTTHDSHFADNITKNVFFTDTVNNKSSLSEAWPLIDSVENKIIPDFLKNKVINYHAVRDIPSIKGTSGLSPYLAIGALSPRTLLFQLLNKSPDLLIADDSDSFVWLNELIWREFYRHLLHHFPRLAKGECFKEKYNGLHWHNDSSLFELWCQGRTGYPIVDAAMRQLNQTGWMHNRLRMVVASFLTKHLLIDWRWGERYFSRKLIDGDLAANNGGWQWAAGTGCDAQPYFRIFNPILQSKRFDPKGIFIRKYLPELKNLPDNIIHFPHLFLQKSALDIYWPPIVEHKFARQRALDFYKRI